MVRKLGPARLKLLGGLRLEISSSSTEPGAMTSVCIQGTLNLHKKEGTETRFVVLRPNSLEYYMNEEDWERRKRPRARLDLCNIKDLKVDGNTLSMSVRVGNLDESLKFSILSADGAKQAHRWRSALLGAGVAVAASSSPPPRIRLQEASQPVDQDALGLERRVDPADGVMYSRAEFHEYYHRWFNDKEVDEHWDSCPLAPRAGHSRRCVSVPATEHMDEHILLVPVFPGTTTVEVLLCEVQERSEQFDLNALFLEGLDTPLNPIDDIFEVSTERHVMAAKSVPCGSASLPARVMR